ncbi:hypothetical protein AMS68_003628 [Peltaster fructicola]|uniref:C2H2-type domain-containing protein n=1 Tax=Peltaster fructicola TaxID=286661 RepID=A0A6H0XTW1_9PEZI|nr:hypothetical protein AMS68_003628 [Peltaster fructicola]
MHLTALAWAAIRQQRSSDLKSPSVTNQQQDQLTATTMSSTTTTTAHPRRTPAPSTSPDNLIDAFHSMSLRKGDTVHLGSQPSNELFNGIEAARGGSPSNPLRATTCPRSLEEMLIGAGERRAADLLSRVDKAIATQSKLALSSVLSDPDVLPAPALEDERIESKTRSRSQRRSHSSDSGIGSSVDSISGKSSYTVGPNTIVAEEASSPVSVVGEERGLSEYAKDQIHKHIVKPILREQTLKEFHPLIKEVPRKIGNKEINTLRELERALIFLAPEYTPSPSKYLAFCERTIRVLHTTVTTLHESDQRAPADRPYTQGYFVDLVEQIRKYALILAATREKQAKGEKLDEMDYSPDESITLEGGVSHNGKQAELVRHKDGKLISVTTGQVLSFEDLASASMKRPITEEDDELADEVARSMARRKKNAKPEIHTCELCDKEFKRPCDLTKHVKTHERPWKCPETDCKYHALGWPTEKERDRHVNDKHSSAPSLYHCLYPPCPYTSKRESNCKQHMEKAHGWQYVRSKNNGKSRASDATRLPQGSIPPSPSSALLTPLTPIAPSPSVQSWSTTSHRESMPPPSIAGPSNYGTPAYAHASPDFSGHFNYSNFDNFNFNDMQAFPMTPMSEDRRTSMSGASSHGLILDGSVYSDAITPDDLNMEASFSLDGPLFPQQPTPNSNLGLSSGMDYNDFSTDSAGPSSAYISPHPSADMAFLPPHATYDDSMQIGDEARPNQDFTLFGTGSTQAASSADMFPSLSEGNGWNNAGSQYDFVAQLKSDNSALNELFPELTNHM